MKTRMLFLFVTLAAFAWSAVAADQPKTDADNAKTKDTAKSTDKEKTKAKDTPKPADADKTKAKDTPKPADADKTKAKDTPKPADTDKTKAKDTPKPADTDKAKAKDTPKPADSDKSKGKDTAKSSPVDKAKAKVAIKPEPAAKPAPLPTGPVPGDAVDFVYLSDARPLLVRLHVQIDGKPVDAVWQEALQELFKYLDRNGNGVLSKDEAEKTPSAQVLLNVNSLYGGTVGVSMSQLDGNKDGKVTLQEFMDYFRKNGGGPFHFQTAPVQQNVYYNVYGMQQNTGNMAEQLNDALFALLDTNKDGKLSRAELAAAPAALLAVDADEDEMVTVEELLPNLNRMNGRRRFVRMQGRQAAQPNSDFVLLNSGDSASKLTKQIQQKYGPKSGAASDHKLTRKEIGLDQASFDELDLDKNGVLDTKELDRFARRAADLEMIVRHGRGRATGPLEVLSKKGQPGSLAASLKSDKGGYILDLGSTRLDLRNANSVGMRASPANIRSIYIMQFKQLDSAKKGYLEQKQVRQNPYLNNSFKMMDRDNDGKLTEKEMLDWIEQITKFQNRTLSSCASLAVSDQGRGLFDLIDTSKDGRLSVREMRNAHKLVDQLDRDGDGQISRSEIPRNFLLAMGQGANVANQNFAPVAFNPYGMNQTGRPNLTAGPLWFRKMDRNRDGDISRKEFLGTDEEFDRIDTDHDGLISLQEAEAFDRLMRAQNAQKVSVAKPK